jgi:GAF domain-containing protein
LFFNYLQPRRFSPNEIAIAETFAHSASLAIYQARLLERESERAEELSVLGEVGQELTTSGIRLRENEILDLIREQAGRVMPMDNMYIALYDAATDTVRFGLAMERGGQLPNQSFLPGSDSGWAPRSSGSGRTEEIIRTKKPIFHRTKTEAKAWYDQADRKEYLGQVSASWIGVPMIVGEKVLGVIAAYHPDLDYAYDDHDLQVLTTLASQAAIALENADLYYGVYQRLVTLNEIGQVLTSGIRLRGDEILELVYEQTGNLMDTRFMYIALYDQDADVVSFPMLGRLAELAMERQRQSFAGRNRFFSGQPMRRKSGIGNPRTKITMVIFLRSTDIWAFR